MDEKQPKKVFVRKILLYFVVAFFIGIVLRMFVFQSFTVKSASMENVFLVGDRVLVNKLAFGGRLPITLLSIPYTHRVVPILGIKSFLDWIELPVMRMPGIKKIRRDDIVVFNNPTQSDLPIDKRDLMMKRCVAVPGDTVEIDNKFVVINNERLKFHHKIKLGFTVCIKNASYDSTFRKKFRIAESQRSGNYRLSLTALQIKELRADSNIYRIKRCVDYRGSFDSLAFPHSQKTGWNFDFSGPVIVPKKGMTVELTKENLRIYYSIIEIMEDNHILEKESCFIINGDVTRTYTFENDYYYVLNDNRADISDSRNWGFLPENHIVGKFGFVWFSHDESGINWHRMF